MLAVIYTTSSVLLALAIYGLFRKLLGPRAAQDDANLSLAVITRLGTLHALILALIFAAEMQNYLGIQKIITMETAAVADVYYGTKRYFDDSNQEAHPIQKNIANYVHSVIDNEWSLLANEKILSDQAWKYYSEVDEGILRLSHANDYQLDIKNQLLKDWDEVSQYRRGREAAALREVPSFFWILAITGFMSVVIPYYVFTPRPTHLLVLSVFAAYNGLVFALILELSEPFSGTGIITPTAYERLYAEDMKLLE